MPDTHDTERVEDQRRIAAVLLGEPGAPAAFFARYEDLIRAAVHGAVPAKYRDDAVQVCCEHLMHRHWRVLKRWSQEGAFRSYLYKVSRNRAIDFYRSERSSRETSLDEESEGEAFQVDGDEGTQGDLTQLRTCLETAAQRLSASQREILNLRHREELGYGDIAARLGRAVGYVSGTLSRAEDALRRKLIGPCKRLAAEWLGLAETAP